MVSPVYAVLSVALGGAFGAVFRHVVTNGAKRFSMQGAWATLVVNLTGAAALGTLAGSGVSLLSDWPWLLLATGALGSYTTVSTLSLQSFEMLRSGEPGMACLNICGSLVLGILTCLAGMALGTALANLA